jgi:hypothetical protein
LVTVPPTVNVGGPASPLSLPPPASPLSPPASLPPLEDDEVVPLVPPVDDVLELVPPVEEDEDEDEDVEDDEVVPLVPPPSPPEELTCGAGCGLGSECCFHTHFSQTARAARGEGASAGSTPRPRRSQIRCTP